MKNETQEHFVEAMSFANQSIPLSPTSEPNTCGNEYAALTGSPYAPRFKEQAYVAEINQLLARVAELEHQRNFNATRIDAYLDVLEQCAKNEWNRGVYGPARQIFKQ